MPCSSKNDDTYLSDLSGVTNTPVVADALIVVPKLDDLVITAGNEVLALSEDGESIELS